MKQAAKADRNPGAPAAPRRPLELPMELRQKLLQFRDRVWLVRAIETVAVLVAAIAASFVTLFLFDRVGDTPPWLRALGWGVLMLVGGVWIPWRLYRWGYCQRTLPQVARLLGTQQPRLGDRLLGVLDLVDNQDQHHSLALCKAAISQVNDETREVNFLTSVPHPRHRQGLVVGGAVALIALLLLAVPGAGTNSFARWLMPWRAIPRFTFAQVEPLPARLAVPLGEPFSVVVKLKEGTPWVPSRGSARYANQPFVPADVDQQSYTFSIPAQVEAADLHVRIGDARGSVRIEPLPRPELTAMNAEITLPEYLGHPEQQQDVRHGQLTVVRGSRTQLQASTSRALRDAAIFAANPRADQPDAVAAKIDGARIELPTWTIADSIERMLSWTDVEGLTAANPFRVRIHMREDRAPGIQCTGLVSDQIVLADEPLRFDVTATDDFGVKQIGVTWQAIDDTPAADPAAYDTRQDDTMEDGARQAGAGQDRSAQDRSGPDRTQPREQDATEQMPHRAEYRGETLLARGDHQVDLLEAIGTFSPKQLGIHAPLIEVRVFAEDYLPGRQRSYSPGYRLYVLDRDQHLIWMTQQLEQWQRQALEVRDEERRLLDENRRLQQLTAAELDQEANRQRLAQQASAERANAARLAKLTGQGEQLIDKAARNPAFDAAALEQWAQVLQALKQLSQQQMPSVANGLASAASAKPSKAAPPPAAPSVSDTVRGSAEDEPAREDAQASPAQSDTSESSKPGGSLQLPVTALPGGTSNGEEEEASDRERKESSARENLDESVEQQEQLLAEFERVMDELKQLLEQLGGSTFVKRLKAVADAELAAASDLHHSLAKSFGEDQNQLADPNRRLLERLANQQTDLARDVRLIQDDLIAYAQRTGLETHQQVHDEMVEYAVVQSFQDLSVALQQNLIGRSIAEAEYWADQLDRWVEILVGPANGKSEESESAACDSIPPAVVLEVLRILKAETDLREATRTVEQLRGTQPDDHYAARAAELRETQDELLQRTQLLIDQLTMAETEEEKDFGGTIKQLQVAWTAMQDATQYLSLPSTAGPTIAAETEAIEALLQSKRTASGGGGGSGGPTPGGGRGEGVADQPSALAGIGDGLMTEQRTVTQAGGTAVEQVPTEYRSGLDAYFSALEEGAQP